MKGAVRVMVLVFTAMKIQRVLLWIGGGLVVLGCLFPPPGGVVGVIFGSVLAMVPSTFASGLLLRYFAAPRGLRLIPHAREQILGGMLLATAVVATLAALLAWRYGGDPVAFWLRAATLASLVLLTQFPLATSVAGTTLWMVAFAGLVQSVNSGGVRHLVISIGQNPAVMTASLIVGWTLFGTWFMRVSALKSPSDVQPYGRRIFKVDNSYPTAIRTFLMGNPSAFHQYSGGLIAVLFITVGWGLMSLFLGSAVSFADAVVKGSPAALGLAAYAGIGGFLIVGRSKFLWLRGTTDRTGLFRLCERQAWRFYGATNVSVVGLFLLMLWINPAIAPKYSLMLLFHLSVGTCVLYLGLMHVRGWRALDLICTFGMMILWVMAGAMIAGSKPLPSLVLVPLFAVLAAVAITFRLIALHRWRNIDWLVCKPARPVARGLQQAH